MQGTTHASVFPRTRYWHSDGSQSTNALVLGPRHIIGSASRLHLPHIAVFKVNAKPLILGIFRDIMILEAEGHEHFSQLYRPSIEFICFIHI